MKKYRIELTKQAIKDIKLLSSKMKDKLKDIVNSVISIDPYLGKKLIGDYKGNYSYRLSLKDRIIYTINEDKKIVYIKRARTHYGE